MDTTPKSPKQQRDSLELQLRKARANVARFAPLTPQQRRDFADAHADGLHTDLPREGCPECERRSI